MHVRVPWFSSQWVSECVCAFISLFLYIVSCPEHAVKTNYIDLASYLLHLTAIFKEIGVDVDVWMCVSPFNDVGRGK